MCLADHMACAARSSLLFNGCNVSAASGAAAAASADGGTSGNTPMQACGFIACVPVVQYRLRRVKQSCVLVAYLATGVTPTPPPPPDGRRTMQTQHAAPTAVLSVGLWLQVTGLDPDDMHPAWRRWSTNVETHRVHE